MKRKLIFVFSLIFIALFALKIQKTHAMINPWTDCNDDISCGAKIAGFNFPLRINNYSIRAMNDMMEITFPLDRKRTVRVRKSQLYQGEISKNGIADISGIYIKYPINQTIKLKNGIEFNTRGYKKKFYVASFAAETGYYSFYCQKGMTIKDINYLYKLLEEAEAPRNCDDETCGYTIEQLRDSRRIDDIVEPIYTQDCFPRTLEKMGVSKNCFERANLGQDVFCSTSEIKMIKEYYKKGQHKDPLNNGEGGFCAK